MAGTRTDDTALTWHALPAERVSAEFGVDPQVGLAQGSVAELRARYGENVLPEPPRSRAERRWRRGAAG